MKLNFAEKFSRYPYGRDATDGTSNGAAFRVILAEEFQEAQKKCEPLDVVLDDVHILTPSFLNEAFGVFAKELKENEGLTLSEKNLSFRGNYPEHRIYIAKIWDYINRRYSSVDKTHAA